MKRIWILIVVAVAGGLLAGALILAADPAGKSEGEGKETKATGKRTQEDKAMAKAMFGAGCFWGVEAAFRQIEGVSETAVGYAGGHTNNPTYKEVCSDETGHAEVVEVTYDPSKVAYEQLLKVFWEAHDPTQVNRQGPDIGSQYRSVIFYESPEQEKGARQSKEELGKSGKYKRPIATSIEKAVPFWKAEEYHQQYLGKRGLSSCKIK